MKGYTHGNRGCEIQMVEDKAIWIGVEDKDVRLGLHHLGAGAGVQQEPDDPEPARGSGLTKDQARLRTGHNQHLQRKLQELLLVTQTGNCSSWKLLDCATEIGNSSCHCHLRHRYRKALELGFLLLSEVLASGSQNRSYLCKTSSPI